MFRPQAKAAEQITSVNIVNIPTPNKRENSHFVSFLNTHINDLIKKNSNGPKRNDDERTVWKKGRSKTFIPLITQLGSFL